ncbi:adenosine kinase [Chelatococcus reniformis]|uniref:Adenosine kinase n=1 Tax=Chelatococcus reniformis TaxID=1494448 RepID=A0A916TXV4_9HYPH|nr:adenosine kinase [Chelatococcus reniformis]GGC51684.1 adenosine kinase [Chelatococcus reniformis]
MTLKRHDVLGIGNALVDILAPADDDFLLAQNVLKGAMQLIDEERAEALYAAMGATVTVSGGSASNTIAGVASFGGRGALIAKVRNDELGKVFAHDLHAIGVTFETAAASEGPATGRCFILVSPDGERTMNTYLGAGQGLGPADIDKAVVDASAIVYLEGYLWDPPEAKLAFLKAAEIAHAGDGRVALTLSDAFCVDRYRDEFLRLVSDGVVDILFANEHELKSLYQTADIDTAVAALRRNPVLGVVTRSEQGSLLVSRDETRAVAACPIDRLVDTTGAGDLFAAGFLVGLAQGADDVTCARLGALAAAEVIQHLGARPERGLKDLATENGLLG